MEETKDSNLIPTEPMNTFWQQWYGIILDFCIIIIGLYYLLRYLGTLYRDERFTIYLTAFALIIFSPVLFAVFYRFMRKIYPKPPNNFWQQWYGILLNFTIFIVELLFLLAFMGIIYGEESFVGDTISYTITGIEVIAPVLFTIYYRIMRKKYPAPSNQYWLTRSGILFKFIVIMIVLVLSTAFIGTLYGEKHYFYGLSLNIAAGLFIFSPILYAVYIRHIRKKYNLPALPSGREWQSGGGLCSSFLCILFILILMLGYIGQLFGKGHFMYAFFMNVGVVLLFLSPLLFGFYYHYMRKKYAALNQQFEQTNRGLLNGSQNQPLYGSFINQSLIATNLDVKDTKRQDSEIPIASRTSSIICSYCGVVNPTDKIICIKCGRLLPELPKE